ncbi:MAB_1171c family putative transporter [Streptomyces sp. NPDC057638]|uniref:MAB_1171c family putative transporter n=1 Tax=Streptomyces sp. NPDC057638 TaxID=3346190 RepID=UPI003697A235
MGEVLAYLPTVLALGFGGYQLTVARRGGAAPAVRLLGWFGVAMGTGMMLLAPTTVDAAHRVVPAVVPALHLGGRLLEMVALAFLPAAAGHLASRGRWTVGPRRLAWITGGALLVCAGLFTAAWPRAFDGGLVPAPGRWPLLAASGAVFTTYTLVCLALFALPVHVRVNGLEPGPLRLGLRLISAAAVVGALWGAWGYEAVIEVVRGHRQVAGLQPVGVTLGTCTLVLAVLGATAARWRPAVAAPARWVRLYRDFRALEPLWSAMHAVVPDAVLGVSWREAGPIAPGLAEFALYRRVVEIRDGYLTLRPYVDPRAHLWVEVALRRYPDSPSCERATVEAATLAAALEAARAGRRYGDRAGPAPVSSPAGDTMDAEAAWLIHVSAAFARACAVEDTRRQARKEFARP